jgi:hypothetical protein
MHLVDSPIWHCDANYITCRSKHPLRYHEADYAVDQRRIDGHIFYGCKSCEPTSFFFGVVTSRPSPMVTCYAITREQFQEWQSSTADSLPTPDMLFRLGYNPSFRASKS